MEPREIKKQKLGSGTEESSQASRSSSTPAVSPPAARIMRNNLLFAKIAKNLPASSLLALRRASASWNWAVCPELRAKHTPIELRNEGGGIGRYTELMRTNTQPSPDTDTGIPFTKYVIPDLCEVLDNAGADFNFNSFFSACGHAIRMLDLSMSTAWALGRGNLRRIVFELAPQLEDLTLTMSLPLTLRDYERRERAHNSVLSIRAPTPAKEIPNLRRLSLDLLDYARQGPFQTFVAELLEQAVGLESLDLSEAAWILNLNIAPAPGHLRGLKSLEIDRINEMADLRHLAQFVSGGGDAGGLQRLEVLRIRISIDWAESTRKIARLAGQILTAAAQTGTLRELELLICDEWDDEARIMPVRVPWMDSLRTLHLTPSVGRYESRYRFQYQFHTLAANFPGLRRVVLDLGGYGDGKLLPVPVSTSRPVAPPSEHSENDSNDGEEDYNYDGVRSQLAHPHVTELQLKLTAGSFEFGNFIAFPFAALWPAVTRLELELSARQVTEGLLSHYLTPWPTLAVLHVRVDFPARGWEQALQLDEILSGVPASSFEALWQELELERVKGRTQGPGSPSLTLEAVRALHAKYKTQSGLSDLAQLQEIDMIVRFHSDEGESQPQAHHDFGSITDISGYFGLGCASPRIQRIRLSISAASGGTAKAGISGISDECRAFIRNAFSLFAVISL